MPTPEAKSDTSRRDFVKLSGAALAFAATQTAKSYAKIVGANDRVRVGVVGCGDRMRGGDIPAFLASAKEMNFQIIAVSDIWKMRREDGAAYIGKLTGDTITPMVNNEALYSRGDIDAVLIATGISSTRSTASRRCGPDAMRTWRSRQHTP